MNNIRTYTPSDLVNVVKWCASANIIPPAPSVFSDSSFILEMDNVPALFISLYLTNSKDVAYLDNLVGNPELKGPLRKRATKELFDYISIYAYNKGYSKLVITAEEKLANYYKTFGYRTANKQLTRIVKDL